MNNPNSKTISRPAHAVDTWLIRELQALERRYKNRCVDSKLESLFPEILSHYLGVGIPKAPPPVPQKKPLDSSGKM